MPRLRRRGHKARSEFLPVAEMTISELRAEAAVIERGEGDYRNGFHRLKRDVDIDRELFKRAKAKEGSKQCETPDALSLVR